MGKIIFEVITSPLSLPIGILWEWLIMALIGVIAFWIAWITAGALGVDSDDRRAIHWFVRIVAFLVLWGLARLGIEIYFALKRENAKYLIAILIVAAVIAGIVIVVLRLRHFKKKDRLPKNR